jgi:hypothetical protein
VDYLVYVPVRLVSVDYYQDTVLCLRGLRQASLSPKEEERKQIADKLLYEEAATTIEKTSDTSFICQLFTHSILYYDVEMKDGYLFAVLVPLSSFVSIYFSSIVSMVFHSLFVLFLLHLLLTPTSWFLNLLW